MKIKRIILFSALHIFLLFSCCFAKTVAVYGDSRDDSKTHGRVVQLISSFGPALVFHLGDFVNTGSKEEEWAVFNTTASELIKNSKFYPVAGNHDNDRQMFLKNFNLPNDSTWYSLDYEGVHFVVLDNNSELRPGSAQFRWLEQDLKSASGKEGFKVVLMHYPIFSNIDRDLKYKKKLKAWLLPLFARYKVDVVFSGHDHNYQHFLYNGMHFVVSGGGGAGLYEGAASANYLKRSLKVHNFCILSVNKGTLNLKAYNLSRRPIDSFFIRSRDSRFQPSRKRNPRIESRKPNL